MSTTDSGADGNPIDQIAEEFVERHRRGERPSIGEYASRYPGLADEIRELFPALVMMERLKPESADVGAPGAFADRAESPEHLGEYRILCRIGAGGMGVVYEAVHELLGNHVALKVMHPRFRSDGGHARRFRDEARAAAGLHHTNIVPVFDFGDHDGIWYYAMQYIRGQGLDRVLAAVLAVSHFDGAWVWPRDRPQAAMHLRPHDDCRYIAVSPDGKWVSTGTHHGRGLKVWDAASGRLVCTLLPDNNWTIPFFSPDGRWLINHDGECWRVGDWSAGPRHTGRGDVAFTPDGRLAAKGGQPGYVPLINPETGRELARLEDPNQDSLGALTFSPDGTRLLGVAGDSFCVRVWDLRLIRRGLADLGLDWDAPPYPPEPAAGPAPAPLTVRVVGADPPTYPR